MLPPLRMLKAGGWPDTDTTTGCVVWQELPTGMLTPATERLTIRSVIFDVVLTAPVLKSSVPVVGPSLMNCVVAVTGMSPASLNDPVALGRVSLAVILPVFASSVEASLPVPRAIVKFAALMNVLPVTLYLACTTVSADAGPAPAATVHTATSPAAAVARTDRTRRNRTSLIRSGLDRVVVGRSTCGKQRSGHRQELTWRSGFGTLGGQPIGGCVPGVHKIPCVMS